jgi:hypothetical protein
MTGKHVKERTVVDYRRRTGDGIPHLTYFDRDSQLSFVWTGNPQDPIEVEHGGYAEPTVAVITTRARSDIPLGPELTHYLADIDPEVVVRQSSAVVAHWFSHICSEWVAAIADGIEPQWVNEVHT